MFVGEGESVLSELVLAVQGGAEQCGVVGVERDHHALIEVAFGGMLGDGGADSGAHVAAEAELDGNLALREFIDQIGIVRGGDGVADTFGAQVERSPDGFGRAGFAGVGGGAEAVVERVGVYAAKKFGRTFLFVAANADADHVALAVEHGELENSLRLLDAEVAGRVENPKQRDAEIAGTPGASTFESVEDGGEILLAAQADADRDVNFGVENVLRFQLLHEAVGDELVVVGAAEMLADRLERHEETSEIGVVVELGGFGEGGGVSMTLAEFNQRRGFDGALKMQVQLGLGKMADEAGWWPVWRGRHGLIVGKAVASG